MKKKQIIHIKIDNPNSIKKEILSNVLTLAQLQKEHSTITDLKEKKFKELENLSRITRKINKQVNSLKRSLPKIKEQKKEFKEVIPKEEIKLTQKSRIIKDSPELERLNQEIVELEQKIRNLSL